jgi:tRNA modification GTPase
VSADTLLACLTPPGRSALATVAVHGPRAWEVVRRHFRLRSGDSLPEEAEAGSFWLGRLGGEVADEVVVALKQTTPQPWVEIHCHGGREVIGMVMGLFAGEGLAVSWPEFLRHTEADPFRARAAEALAHAPTVRTAGVLLDQYHGAYARAVAAVDTLLEKGGLAGAEKALTDLARHAPVGRHLTEPWRVVVAGAPNVGKSSLINALAGYQRSVVSATPGTTRDVVTTRLAIDGWPVELSDTAGQRAGGEDLEQQGIDLARSVSASADLRLWVLDGSEGLARPETRPANLRLLINKTDLPAGWDWDEETDALHVSAKTGAGIPELCEALSDWLVPDPPTPGEPVPFTPALADAVEEALAHVRTGRGEEARGVLAP